MAEFTELSDTERFEALLVEGMRANEQGDPERALGHFAVAAEMTPGDPRPFHLAAATWVQAGQLDAANDAFREALIRDPELHVARFQWGLMQYGQETMEIAASIWEPLLTLPDGAPLRQFVEGLMMVAAGDITLAIARLESGIAANTGNSPLNADMARIAEGLRPLLTVESPAQSEGEPASQIDANEHFLLGAYRSPDQPLH